MNRIDKKFKALKKARKKAFIAFITAGYPDLKTTEKLILSLSKSAVDILELGVPFSDPLADGAVIQESSQAALKKGINLSRILGLVKKVRKLTEVPLCLMTYYNPIFCFGEEKFLKAAKQAGVDAVIIPDLPPEEGQSFIKSANNYGVHNICFLSPTSSKERIRLISKVARGFIYYVSLTGVTGARKVLPKDLLNHVRSIKRVVKKPVCVGFGISAPSQVREIQRIADGVIVGSAIVKQIKNNAGKKDLVKKVTNFVEHLVKA